MHVCGVRVSIVLQWCQISIIASQITNNSTVISTVFNSRENIKDTHWWPFMRRINRLLQLHVPYNYMHVSVRLMTADQSQSTLCGLDATKALMLHGLRIFGWYLVYRLILFTTKLVPYGSVAVIWKYRELNGDLWDLYHITPDDMV